MILKCLYNIKFEILSSYKRLNSSNVENELWHIFVEVIRSFSYSCIKRAISEYKLFGLTKLIKCFKLLDIFI